MVTIDPKIQKYEQVPYSTVKLLNSAEIEDKCSSHIEDILKNRNSNPSHLLSRTSCISKNNLHSSNHKSRTEEFDGIFKSRRRCMTMRGTSSRSYVRDCIHRYKLIASAPRVIASIPPIEGKKKV